MIDNLNWFVVILNFLISVFFEYFIFKFILPIPRIGVGVIDSVIGYTTGPVIQKPQFYIHDLTLITGLKGIDLYLTLEIYNPNNVPIILDRATFDIYINNIKVGTVNLPQAVYVPVNSYEYPKVSITVLYNEDLAGDWEYIKEKLFDDRVHLKIEGNASVSVPILGKVTIPFSSSKEIE
jgi:LEA14-like dessication related protein